MKKSLLGLLVALIAFFCGILTTKVFHFKQEFISKLVVQEIKITKLAPTQPSIIQPKVVEVKESEPEEVFSNEDFIGGWYSLDRTIKGMEEVNLIDLNTEWTGKNNERLVRSASVVTGNEGPNIRFFDSVWAEIDNKKVKFRTKKIKAVEYRFEGVFFKNKTSGKNGEKVLRGTLKKFVKGKKVAEGSGDFAFYEPHCLY